MSKRLGNFQDGQTKKQKCDTEDPWGDDIDIDALDSYIELVENLTQVQFTFEYISNDSKVEFCRIRIN